MKKNFAKYLPDEGEIKQMDKYFDEGQVLTATLSSGQGGDYSGFQKAKLFVCSRDMQIGDTVHDSVTGMTMTLTEQDYKEISEQNAWVNYCKPLGKISPDATWVTDGMELDSKDLAWQYRDEDGNIEAVIRWLSILPEDAKKSDTIGIRCPCPSSIKHFH